MTENCKDMKFAEIEQLIEKYYAGQTDRCDEDRLVELIKAVGQLPCNLEADCRAFLALKEASFDVPESLEAELKKRFETESRKDAVNFRRRIWWSLGAAAAAIAIFLSIGPSTPSKATVITDDELKIGYAEAALLDVALQLEYASNQLSEMEIINEK